MRLGPTRAQIDGHLYDRLVAALESDSPQVKLLVVSDTGITATDCELLSTALEAARTTVRADPDLRAFIGGVYEGVPKLLEWRHERMTAVGPLREKRLRRSPLAAGD